MITFDVSDVARAARWVDDVAGQLPFALSKTLNASLNATHKELTEDTWPSFITAKNKTFPRFALKRKFSKKEDLSVEMSDAHMGSRAGVISRLASGGWKVARSGAIAIPSKDLQARRTGRGIPKNLKPRALPNSFRKGDEIYQRTGRKGRVLKMRYTLKKATTTPKKVPLKEEFTRIMGREFERQLPIHLREAIRTARR